MSVPTIERIQNNPKFLAMVETKRKFSWTLAIIMLAISLGAGLVTCGAATGVMSVIGLIEGIIYLTKPDEEFEQLYVQGHKGWF